MFKLQRENNKSFKSGERIDFKFSSFQALQVPKGWDRLFLSMISVETGKTIAKLGKAVVRNGSCQWTETVLKSVWISKNDSSKELEDCLFKLVISMGSSRAGILGEATINISSYMSSRVSPVSLPLRKCNFGTSLQVKINCLTPRPNLRHENQNSSGFHAKDHVVDYHDKDHKPTTSDDSLANGARNSSSQDSDFTSHHGKYDNKESSNSNHISKFTEGSRTREHFNSTDTLNGIGYSLHRRHVSASSNSSSPEHSLSSQSSCNSGVMNPKINLQSGKESGAASPSNAGSKSLLEDADGTMEELRAKAKMWERNARKLMLDLDMMRNEFSDQSKKQADLVMELSAAYAEHDGLKKEIEHLKLVLEESAVKQNAKEDSTFQSDGLTHIQKELESEIKYQKESNADLILQLKRSQESNIELVSVLQEMEETIEQQKAELENLSELQLTFTDVEQNLEEKRSLLLQFQQLQESEKTLQVNVQLLEKALEEKIYEIENERNLNSQSLLNVEREHKYKLLLKEDELAKLEAKFQESVGGRQTEDMVEHNEVDDDVIRELESLREKVHELERDCNELTDENLELLFKLKDSKNNYIDKCTSFSSTSSDLPSKSASAQSKVSDAEPQWTASETSELFLELLKQIEMAFHHVMKPISNISSVVSDKCKYLLDDMVKLSKEDIPNSKLWAESVVKYFFELNKLLEYRFIECEEIFINGALEIEKKNEIIAEAEKNLEDHILKVQEHESSKAGLEADYKNLLKGLCQKRSEVDKLEADLLQKEVEINSLIQHQRELEMHIDDLEKRKDRLEENNKIVQRESNITSKCLDDLRNDLAVRSSSLDSHVSAKKILERKSVELETEKCKVENKMVELEQENLLLLERMSVMDVQMMQFKDENESCQLELKNSQSVSISLQDHIRKLEIEMETHETNLKQELEDTRNELLEAQRECECYKTENQELQASALRLSEERKILQKLNKELKKKELELHEHCTQIEAQFEESEKSFSDCSKKVEALEENLTLILEASAAKEKRLQLELDALLQENGNEKEKLIRQETLWNQMHLEMAAELENLQKEVEFVTMRISEVNEEKEKQESESSCEILSLRAHTAKLESALLEVHTKAESRESEVNTVREASQLKAQSLITELAACKQNHAVVVSDHEKLLKQLAKCRRTEEKLKAAVNDLELKLTVSDYENQQLREENANKKFQFLRIDDLQDEVIVLKSKIEECRFEKEKLEAALQKISGEHESLKTEKISCIERISSLEETMSEYESCKQRRMALEKKLLQLEGALLGKETLFAEKIDPENELNEVKKAINQYQLKINHLEEENAEYSNKAHDLEEYLRMVTEKLYCGRKDQSLCAVEGRHVSKTNELNDASEEDNIHKIELQSFSSEEESSQEGNLKKSSTIDSPVVAKEMYERTKSSLETELKDLRERYFHMSLKYAEVEAQREDLVMKLKAAKTRKRWF